jgi:hypothetical protein
VNVVSQTSLTVPLTIASDAPPGARNVTVTTQFGTSNAVTFTVTGIPPSLTSIAPSSGMLDSQVSVTLTGTVFFQGGTTVAVSGTGVTVSNLNVTSSTSLTATFTIASSATLGARDVTVETMNGTSNALTFTVVGRPPTLTSTNIDNGNKNTTVDITLTGQWFVTGTTSAGISGPGVTVGSVSVLSQTSLTVSLTIAGNAASGSRSLRVTTPYGTSNAILFTVNGALETPTLTTINPAFAPRSSAVLVTVTGTGFVLNQTTFAFTGGTGISVAQVTLADSTSLTAQFTITSTAEIGDRGVTVTTPNGTSNSITFSVNAERRRPGQITSQ